MILGTLGASLLGKIFAGKRILRGGSGNKKEKGNARAGYGKEWVFSPASSINKLLNTKVLWE